MNERLAWIVLLAMTIFKTNMLPPSSHMITWNQLSHSKLEFLNENKSINWVYSKVNQYIVLLIIKFEFYFAFDTLKTYEKFNKLEATQSMHMNDIQIVSS